MPTAAGVIDSFLHPPLGLLRPHLDLFGPYSHGVTGGNFSLTHCAIHDSISAVDVTFGVIVQLVDAIPPELGNKLGWVDEGGIIGSEGTVYSDMTFQVVVLHELLGGSFVITQEVRSNHNQQLVMWDVALPGMIGLYVPPHLSVDLYYLDLIV